MTLQLQLLVWSRFVIRIIVINAPLILFLESNGGSIKLYYKYVCEHAVLTSWPAGGVQLMLIGRSLPASTTPCSHIHIQTLSLWCLVSTNDIIQCTENWSKLLASLDLLLCNKHCAGKHTYMSCVAQAPPCCTKCNSPPINGQCTNNRIVV